MLIYSKLEEYLTRNVCRKPAKASSTTIERQYLHSLYKQKKMVVVSFQNQSNMFIVLNSVEEAKFRRKTSEQNENNFKFFLYTDKNRQNAKNEYKNTRID